MSPAVPTSQFFGASGSGLSTERAARYLWQMARRDDRRTLRSQGASPRVSIMSLSHLDDQWLYQCDGIVVVPCAHRLEHDGQARPVEPKVYTVLVTLLEQAGNVVDKDTLLDAAWGHRCVTPSVLSHAISQLRHALGDSARHPRYIATVHTIGYRFIGEVQRRSRLAPAPTEPVPGGRVRWHRRHLASGFGFRLATR
jgi:DNA-binding winged helix-turn-helix (wHTH) protein